MSVKKNPNIYVCHHPLISHKMAILRNKYTSIVEFRRAIKEIAMLECYEALHDIPTVVQTIATPLETTRQQIIKEKEICFVPILRAGLAMAEGFIDLMPRAKVGHIGIYRNPKTKKPVEYFIKLPRNISKLRVFLIDPMLATGGSAIEAVKRLYKHGAKNVAFVCMVAAPEGVKAFTKACPHVKLYIGTLDRELNKNKYILPGIGDAGDRIYGTEEEI